MRRAFLYAVLLLAVVSSAFATTRIIPVAGHVPGANDTAWSTDVSLRNNSGAAMTVELLFHSDTGLTRSRSVIVPAGSAVLLEGAAAPSKFPGTNPASWLGQLEIRAPGDITASAHIFTQGKHGGTYGSTYEGIDPAVLSTSGAIAGLVNSDRFRSNVAFTNPTAEAISVTYTLRREDGTIAASRSLDLTAHTTRQLSLASDVAAGEGRLSLFWSATGRAYAVGSIIDNRSGDPTSAPSVSRNATSLFFPVVGRTAGGNSTFWSTSASIASASASAASVTFAYTDAATGSTYTRTALLPALGSMSTDDVNELVGAPAGLGSLRVSSTAPLAAVVRVFNTLTDGSTFGSSVLPQLDVVRSTNVSIDGVRRDDAYRLNVAVASDGATAAEGRIRLFDERGVEVGNQPFRAEQGKPLQVGVGGNVAVRAGELRIETTNGVSVTAVASNVDNVTGDTLQRESQQETERQNELEITMSTRTAAIGVPVTFGLKHAGADVASVKWQFGDGTGATGTNVTHSYITAGEFNVTVEVTLAGGAIVRDREDLRITGSSTAPPASSAIDFTWSPANPQPGQQVVFTATGATNGGFFKWKFPGDIRPIGNTVTFTFPAAGAFQVEVEIEHGATVAEITRIVTVGGSSTGTPGTPGAGPINFTFSPANPQAGQEVTFTATGNTGGGVFKWKFPGNIRKFGSTTTFTFAANGSYEVEVEVEHGAVIAEITKIVTVGSTTPTNPNPGTGTGALNFTFSPQSPAVGQEVTFTATGNTGGGVYKWKFPGDIRKLGAVVTFTFASAGSFPVEVEVEHGTIESEVTKIVTVGGGSTPNPNPGPTEPLNFTFSPSAPTAGQVVTFTATGSTGGGIYKWKFPGDVRKTGAVVTFTFASAGSYQVELEIEHGTIISEIRKTVTVTGGSTPTPSSPLNFTYSPSSPRAGQTVTFTATGDTGGGTYEWRFPNGVEKAGAVATFTFPTAGSYEVELRIEDGSVDGRVRKTITVSP